MRTQNRKGEGARLREELVDAAESLLFEQGDDRSVSLRAVARAAGVSAPSVYLHFEGKDDIVRAVLSRRFADLRRHIAETTDDVADPLGRLRAGAHAYCDWASAEPGGYRLLFNSPLATDPRFAGEGAAAFGHLVDRVEAVQRAGRGAQGDAWRLATLLWSGLHGLLVLRESRPGFPWPPLSSLVDELVDSLIGPPAAASRP